MYGKNNWKYCYDPGEILCVSAGKNGNGEKRYKDIITNSTPVDEVMKNWQKDPNQSWPKEVSQFLKSVFKKEDIE
jgi:hypothetical protein